MRSRGYHTLELRVGYVERRDARLSGSAGGFGDEIVGWCRALTGDDSESTWGRRLDTNRRHPVQSKTVLRILKIGWGATLVPVRVLAAPETHTPADVPSGVKVAHGTLNPIVQVRILARQPGNDRLSDTRSRVAQLVERAAVNR